MATLSPLAGVVLTKADGSTYDLSGLGSAAEGAGTSATAARVVVASDDALIGPVNETAPASDTASSGHNGRLQRIAQRITSLIALLPASIGLKASAGSVSVTVANDDAVIGTAADAAWTSGSGTLAALLKAIANAAISTNPVQTYKSDSYNNITTKTDTVVKSGAGTLIRIVISPGTTDTLTIYDNTAASGTKIGTVTIGATTIVSLEYGCAFSTGLTITSGGGAAGNYTVIYR